MRQKVIRSMKIFWATSFNTIHTWMQWSWRVNLYFCPIISSGQPFLRWWFNMSDLRTDTHKSIFTAVAILGFARNVFMRAFVFWTARRLKIYLRSSILNSLIIAAAITEILDIINLVDIAKDFISRNETPDRLAVHCDSTTCCVWFWFSMWF